MVTCHYNKLRYIKLNNILQSPSVCSKLGSQLTALSAIWACFFFFFCWESVCTMAHQPLLKTPAELPYHLLGVYGVSFEHPGSNDIQWEQAVCDESINNQFAGISISIAARAPFHTADAALSRLGQCTVLKVHSCFSHLADSQKHPAACFIQKICTITIYTHYLVCVYAHTQTPLVCIMTESIEERGARISF